VLPSGTKDRIGRWVHRDVSRPWSGRGGGPIDHWIRSRTTPARTVPAGGGFRGRPSAWAQWDRRPPRWPEGSAGSPWPPVVSHRFGCPADCPSTNLPRQQGYARILIPRHAAGWAVSKSQPCRYR